MDYVETIIDTDTGHVESDSDRLDSDWENLFNQYYSDEPHDNHSVLRMVQNPKELIEHKSREIMIDHISTRDITNYLQDISLIINLAEKRNVQIFEDSHPYRIIQHMSDIPFDKIEDMLFYDAWLLSETLKISSNLLPEAGFNPRTVNLNEKLLTLSDRILDYLGNPDDFGYYDIDPEEEEYNRYIDTTNESFSFKPTSWMITDGEDEYYNHTNVVFDGEANYLSKYNIYGYEDPSEYYNTIYFKSCGIFIEIPPDCSTCYVDFTPQGYTQPGEVSDKEAIAMAYRGMKNYFHALDNGELGNAHHTHLEGKTNATMARFASRFGFKIKLYDESINDNRFVDINYLKENKTSLDDEDIYEVIGEISDIRKALNNFDEQGYGKKIVMGFGNR
ncbi:hypothetical protein K0B04_00920 [Patescibacteria group bacterium]|nr:hypothetical protein [Patescibacteria group bacterium]